MFKTTESLKLTETKMESMSMLGFQRELEELTRDGMLSMLTKQRKFKQKDLSEILVSMPTDHSTSDPRWESGEFLNAMVPTMLI